MTPDSNSCDSDKSAYDSWKARQAVSRRFKSCRLSMSLSVSSGQYDIHADRRKLRILLSNSSPRRRRSNPASVMYFGSYFFLWSSKAQSFWSGASGEFQIGPCAAESAIVSPLRAENQAAL